MNSSQEQIIILLEEKGIKLVADDEKVYIDYRLSHNIPLENHYGISIENEGHWCYSFYILERRNIPEIKILKQFQNRQQALNYLFSNKFIDVLTVDEKIDWKQVKNYKT